MTGYHGIASTETLTIERGEATNLLFPNTQSISIILYRKTVEWSPQNDKDQYNHASFASILHYNSVYCLMDIFMLFPQSFVRVWFFWESRLQHKFTWSLNFFSNLEISKFPENLEILNIKKKKIFNFRILNIFENLEILWNFMKTEIFEIWNFILNFRVFVN